MRPLERKPDAGNPHVRFDERGVETEMHDRLLRHRQPKGPDTAMACLTITAPLLDSTQTELAEFATFKQIFNL